MTPYLSLRVDRTPDNRQRHRTHPLNDPMNDEALTDFALFFELTARLSTWKRKQKTRRRLSLRRAKLQGRMKMKQIVQN